MASEKSYWDSRYERGYDSGYGSYGEQLEKKLNWICGLEFDSITEIGCGDFNFGKNILLRHPAKYTGVDISETVINKNKLFFPEHTFMVAGDGVPPKADLVLCVDVLFHVLDDEEVVSLLDELEGLWTKYLVVTAYERDQVGGLAPHVKIRNFDYKRFGEPIIREIVEEDGNLYFYIFKK